MVSFDDKHDIIIWENASDVLVTDADYSISFWVYIVSENSYSGGHYVLYAGTSAGYYYIAINPNSLGVYGYHFISGFPYGAGSTGCLSKEEWVHVCFTFDYSTSTLALYVNGEYKDSNSGSEINVSAFSGPLTMGSNGMVGSAISKGMYFSDLAIYNVTLSQYDIIRLYNSGIEESDGVLNRSGKSLTVPIHHYKLQEDITSDDKVINDSGLLDIPCVSTYPGSPTYRTSGVGGNYSIEFAGTAGEYIKGVDLTSGAFATQYGHSYSFWINVDSYPSSGNHSILGVDNASYIYINTSGKLGYYIRYGAATSLLETRESINGGNWYHVVCTYDMSHMKIYLNGELNNIKTETSIVNSGIDINRFLIGAFDGLSAFDGYIMDVRQYDKSITDNEIKTIYELGLQGDID